MVYQANSVPLYQMGTYIEGQAPSFPLSQWECKWYDFLETIPIMPCGNMLLKLWNIIPKIIVGMLHALYQCFQVTFPQYLKGMAHYS